MGDEAGTPRYVETVPKRGYRFIAALSESVQGNVAVQTGPVLVTLAATPPLAVPGPSRLVPWMMKGGAVFFILLAAAGGWYQSVRHGRRLTEKDTIVVADFANSTGDAIFDDTLKTALSISLRQSPFLNMLSDSEVTATLQMMTRPIGTRLVPEVTRELCQRAGSKAYITGSIGNLGSEYVLGIRAINCQNGDTLAQEQVTAASKEKVLDALGSAASKLRAQLGESLATVQQFDVPLERATTPSLEAQGVQPGRKSIQRKRRRRRSAIRSTVCRLAPILRWATVTSQRIFTLGELERTSEYLAKASSCGARQ